MLALPSAPLLQEAPAIQELVKPLGGHAVFLLLVQLALLLLAARLGAELAKRLGLPAVVGELSAGLVLGPSVLGMLAPAFAGTVFPQDPVHSHLLEVVGTLGMVLLLLLTGLETDLRLLKNLGRAALVVSLMGMLVPFVSGFGLGLLMPDEYLANAERRVLFSFFLATAMAISAMPVIAKILIDLDLTQRDIGLVILSAGVVDDTAGWLILSVISGVAASGELRFAGLATTLLLTGGFLLVMALFVHPLSRWLMWLATRWFRTSDTASVLLLVVTFLCAAVTEWIGVHAVFGAFVCGAMFRQVPELEVQTVHRLETFVYNVLAPIFFGIVGLKCDLWQLGGSGLLWIVLGVACLGKLLGCTIGSLWGGLSFWEGVSIATAMNARGAMELVLATIGLSLGILNQQMFSIIVVVAIVTSFLAPLGLRFTVRRVRITDEEARRLAVRGHRGFLDPERVRILLPTMGGPNAAAAAHFACGLSRRSSHPVQVVCFEPKRSLGERLRNLLSHRRGQASNRQAIEPVLLDAGLPPVLKCIERADPACAIVDMARKHDLVVLGASHRGSVFGGPILEAVVQSAARHVAIVRAGREKPRFRHLLVRFDGSVLARIAVEVAVRYAEAADAEVTIAIPSERRPNGVAAPPSAPSPTEDGAGTVQALERISPVFGTTNLRPIIHQLLGDPASALDELLCTARYDLVVIGAENRSLKERLFFGYENERIIGKLETAVAVIVPNLPH
jgi:Kef-type K+ transport system membrane component KefB/nucleotide-binding universal stress UspA family protein